MRNPLLDTSYLDNTNPINNARSSGAQPHNPLLEMLSLLAISSLDEQGSDVQTQLQNSWYSQFIDKPSLVPLSCLDSDYRSVKTQFEEGWRHPTRRPNIRYVYKVKPSWIVEEEYENYRWGIERSAQLSESRDWIGLGNECRRWHGTFRACRLGDDPSQIHFCPTTTCNLCSILKTRLQVPKVKQRFERFGRGIYLTSTSSKANDYSRSPNSRFKALILSRVALGVGYKPRNDLPQLSQPPSGYASVIGEVGMHGALNYDEVVVYRNEATCPAYLVIYD